MFQQHPTQSFLVKVSSKVQLSIPSLEGGQQRLPGEALQGQSTQTLLDSLPASSLLSFMDFLRQNKY